MYIPVREITIVKKNLNDSGSIYNEGNVIIRITIVNKTGC